MDKLDKIFNMEPFELKKLTREDKPLEKIQETSDDKIRHAIELLLPIAKIRKVPFILNDRPDLAHELGCDGVHLGHQPVLFSTLEFQLGVLSLVVPDLTAVVVQEPVLSAAPVQAIISGTAVHAVIAFWPRSTSRPFSP